MIPLRDSIPARITPWVNFAIVGLCAIAFLGQLSAGANSSRVVEQLGMIPARVIDPSGELFVDQQVVVETRQGRQLQVVRHEIASPVIPPLLTFVTCMFLHGGWMHFLGNMWFLYIFGDNVEDRFGHVGYAAVYLGTGIIASLAHFLTDMNSAVPTIGASGAIAGVMGAYAVLYPHARVQGVIPLMFVFPVFVLPAPVFLGIWFVIQLVSGISSGAGGVAWWAHIGGFVAGAAVAAICGKAHLTRDAVRGRRF